MPALFDTLSRQFDDEMVRKINDQVGGEPGAVRKAIQAGLPLLVGALARNTSQAGGAEALTQALDRDHDGSLLDNLGEVLGLSARGASLTDAASGLPGGLSVDRRAVDGAGILRHLFGDKQAAVETGISKASGLDVRHVGKLLAVLAPIVLGTLGRLRRDYDLDAGGVQDLLREERGALEAEAPGAGQGGLLGLLDRDDDGQLIDEVERLGKALGGTDRLRSLFAGRAKGRRET